MDRLGRNLGGRIPSCSQYWKCYNSSYDGTDWDHNHNHNHKFNQLTQRVTCGYSCKE